MVFIGPYEHHSNELPWRESIADVVVIPEDAAGHIDTACLEAELIAHADRPLLIGSFSAASNVTGIRSDTTTIATLLHRYGARSFWDYAAAAPYVPIDMSSPSEGPAYFDAVFLSPHKLIGGPGSPGVLATDSMMPSDMLGKAGLGTSRTVDSDTSTVRPLNATALPAVPIVSATAARAAR